VKFEKFSTPITLEDRSSTNPKLNITISALTIANDFLFSDQGAQKKIQLIAGSNGIATLTGNIELADVGTTDNAFVVDVDNTLTLNGVVSGVGRLLLDNGLGGGTLIVNGDNTYTGGTLVEEGKLVVNHNNALGTGVVTIEDRGINPKLEIGDGVTISNALIISNVNDDKTLQLEGGGGKTGEYAGQITLNEAGTNNFYINSSSTTGTNNDPTQVFTISGKITGTGTATNENAINIGGDGVVVLTNAANDFTGNIRLRVNRGSTLRVGSNTALGSAVVSLDGNDMWLQLSDGVTTTSTSSLVVTDRFKNKVLEIYNANPAGAESATFGGSVTINENGTNHFDVRAAANDTLTITGVISGAGTAGINKIGEGTLILTNNNTYAGKTRVKRGTLALTGSASIAASTEINLGDDFVNGFDGKLDVSGLSSDFTLGNGQMLTGTGEVIGGSNAIQVATGIVAPGNSMGTLVVNANLIMGIDSALDFELNGLDVAIGGNVNDLITVVGDFTLDGVLNVTTPVNDFSGASEGEYWTLVEYSGVLTDNGLDFNGAGLGLPSTLRFEIDTTNYQGSVVLLVTAVPEPSSAALFVCGGLTLLLRRRRI